jgi:hypothetical protein
MADQEPRAADGAAEQRGTTRRGMLRGAAGIGAAGLAAGVLAGAAAVPAAAATAKATGPGETAAVPHEEPLVVHVRDARTGVVDLYTGTRHVRFTDRQLAARLSRAAG